MAERHIWICSRCDTEAEGEEKARGSWWQLRNSASSMDPRGDRQFDFCSTQCFLDWAQSAKELRAQARTRNKAEFTTPTDGHVVAYNAVLEVT